MRAADEAMLEIEKQNLAAFERVHELGPIPLFDNDTIAALDEGLRNAVAIGNELNALSIQGNLDAQLESIIDGLDRAREKADDLARAITENLVSALEDGLVGSFNALADVLGGVTDGGMAQVTKALLEPLADMAIKAGTLIMMSGEAIDALKKSLVSFFGGSAVVAGAALVAVGVAAKAGLAAIGSGAGGGTGITAASTSTAPYGGATGVQSAELVVRVEGSIKGSDIVLSGENTLKNWNR